MSLDALRAFAALVVFSEHCRHIFFVEYHELANKFLLPPYLMTAAGHQAVVIFFVLSGFLVGGSIIRSLQIDRWSWSRYFTHRFVRLWLVLIPALLLGFFWDSLNLRWHHHLAGQSSMLLHHLHGTVGAPPMERRLDLNLHSSPATFVGNIFFLQTILVPPLGSNGPLWSLANEFWYYLLFPLALFAIIKRYSPVSRVLFAIAAAFICWFIGKDILLLFPLWLMGVALVYTPRIRTTATSRILATFAYIAILLACVQLRRTHGLLSDYILGVVTWAFLWLLLSATDASSKGTREFMTRTMARFSYTLYLVHMPFLIFVGSFLVHDSRWKPNGTTLLIAFVISSVTLGYAWLLASITEFRVDQVKRWAEARVMRLFP